MGLVLQPKIARVFLPALQPRRFKGFSGGRGGMKSHFLAEHAVCEAVSGHQRFVFAREHQNSIADSSKQLIEDKIASLGLNDLFKVTDQEITCPSTESLFIFRGLKKHTVASIKSLEGFTRFIGDEAQTFSQKSLDVAIPTFRAPGSEIRLAWNPNAATDPVDKMFADNQNDPDFLHIKVNYPDNPWFPEELRKDMERDKKRDFEKYLHVWRGEYQRNSEARVFKNFVVEPFETPDDAIFYHGADWGFSIDPTVLVRCFIKGRTLYVDREAYKVGCEIDHTPALFDKLDPDRPGVARKWRIRADSARPETISYMRRNGYDKIEGALKGPSSVMDGIEFLKSYDIVVHPRCKHTGDELMHYSFKLDPLTNDVTNVLDDKKNHVIDSLRYAVESIRRKNPKPVFGVYGNNI